MFLALVAALLLVGFVAYRNAARIAEWAAECALPRATVRIGELRLAPHSIEARAVVIAEKGGAEVLAVSLLRVRFNLGDLLARHVESVSLQELTLNLSQGVDQQWNIERVLPEPSPQRPSKRFRIGELSVTAAQIVVGTNAIVGGLAPIEVGATVREVDTTNLRAMSGEGTVRLPLCDVRLLDRPVAVSGLAGKLALRFGKSAGSLFSAEGAARAAQVRYKGTVVESLAATLHATERGMQSTNVTASFYGSPVTGFGALHVDATPIWFNAGLELKQANMAKLTAAIVPERFHTDGTSYLYVEAAGNLDEPVTWAKLHFKTLSAGTIYVKELSKLLAASNLPPDKQQLFLLAFDRGELLPYKSAWLSADVHARTLTVATYFERQAKWFFGLEVQPPPFEIPMALLKEKGWLP